MKVVDSFSIVERSKQADIKVFSLGKNIGKNKLMMYHYGLNRHSPLSCKSSERVKVLDVCGCYVPRIASALVAYRAPDKRERVLRIIEIQR